MYLKDEEKSLNKQAKRDKLTGSFFDFYIDIEKKLENEGYIFRSISQMKYGKTFNSFELETKPITMSPFYSKN